jgi:hypothetical protein
MIGMPSRLVNMLHRASGNKPHRETDARTENVYLLKLLVLMLRTSKKFDRALTVIAFFHRSFAKRAHTDRWLYAASDGA